MSEYQNVAREIGWDDQIVADGEQYILLEENDYDFTVIGFERSRFPGSAKIPACNKAIITLAVDTPEGTAKCRYELIMWSTLEWKISAFFRAIGQKKHGEALAPRWNQIVGSKGRAHFKSKSYEKNGETKFYNDVTTFYDYTGSTSQNATNNNGGWQGGKF